MQKSAHNSTKILGIDKRILFGLVAVLIIVAVAVLMVTKIKGKSADAAPAKAVLTVDVAQPIVEKWSMTVTVNGSVASWQEAVIGAEIGGLRIAQVLVDVGTEVKKGQILAMLADETVRADIQQQQAEVSKARASLAEAKSNADRARGIKDSGALSTQQINQYLIAEETAQAALASSQATLVNQQIRLKQTHVVAVDDGVISSRSANLGNVVAVGAELFRLLRQGRIEWRAEVNAEQLLHIHKGQKVHLTLPDNKQVIGTVRIAAPTLNVETRNALIYVDMPKASARPGMYAQGEIEVGESDAISVPQSAIILRDGHNYIFEVGTDNRVIQHGVTLGRRKGNRVEITGQIGADDAQSFSLTPQTRIVATGGAFLSDGDLVSINSNVKNTAEQSGHSEGSK